MSVPQVKAITITKPITAVGKVYKGDYAKSSEHITEIQKELGKKAIPFVPNKVMGVYYDNPQETNMEDLKSFQGIFVPDEKADIDSALTKLSLQGNYLYITVSGDPVKSIYEGYGALFSHIQQNNVKLKSPAGYQVSTFENGVVTTEIFMELAD